MRKESLDDAGYPRHAAAALVADDHDYDEAYAPNLQYDPDRDDCVGPDDEDDCDDDGEFDVENDDRDDSS